MPRAILALDQGTTSSRAILLDRQGRVLASAQQEFAQHYPQPGWVEHDLNEIWRTQRDTARAALKQAGLNAKDVAAIGIANQRETTALWDRKTGEPVAPAIVWQCRRTAGRCREIRERGDEPMLRGKTGLVVDAYFSATKLAWLLDHVPGARARAERGELAFGTIDSWLVWKLSGGRLHVTDPSNASRTLLCNLASQSWDTSLLDYFGIPASLLPEIRPSSQVYGETDADVLGAPVPIAGIAGDQQAALFGQGCTQPGMLKNTYGTGCFLLVHAGSNVPQPPAGILASAACRLGGEPAYVLEGAVFIAGAAIQWLRDGLGLFATAAESEALAASVRDTGGVHFVPAFVGLGAPHWNADARGALAGLTRGTTRAHIARAALEAIAFQTVDLVHAMGIGGTPPPAPPRVRGGEIGNALGESVAQQVLRVDGGASANNLLMQIQADLLGLPVERPKVLETTAAGAAYLAGLATGFWGGLDEVAAIRAVDRVFEPQRDAGWREEQLAGWRKAVQRVLL